MASVPTEFSLDTVFAKSGKAHAELRERRHGLNARLRQLLILTDGKRTVGELARWLPDLDVAESLGALEREGYVARALGDAAPVMPGWEPLPAVRERVADALYASIGSAGEEMAQRVMRCASREEVREVLPAALSIVEAVGGRVATQVFLHRAGRI